MTPGEFYEALHARELTSDFAIVTPAPSIISEPASQLRPDGSIPVDEISPILAPHVGQLGFLRAQRGELVDSLTLDANYIRRSDAELHLKAPAKS